MASCQTSSPKRRKIKLFLGAPLLLASLAFHGLVLSLPMPGEETEEEAVVEPGSPEAPLDAIQVSRLPSAATRPDPPSNEASTKAKPPPTAAQPAAPTATPAPAQAQAPAPVQAEPEQQAAADPPPPSDLEPLPAEPPPPTLEERLRDSSSYTPNNLAKEAAGTSDFTNWYLAALSTQGDGSSLEMGDKGLEPLRIQYPLNTCLTPAPVEGGLGVVVNPDGTVNREPEILASTGYDVLDDQAKAAISNYPFPQRGALVAYGLSVVVEYDAATCVPPN
ncbi:hypothetical protein [Pseudanabaena sp. FACHB-2040]|uniref:energy transducer TonB n=1 Tax=Pseudanabaena sp. FACHB-2040 TaxID=2692859 RepID=UPI001682CE65|nr:hypothetical protein [Pseudanabaena sp. FACHB-2040]MBD2257748.1 hypothetical protein [Pseudanabaena sp. FACHB-2040]